MPSPLSPLTHTHTHTDTSTHTAPGPPQNLAVSVLGPNSLQLSWEAPPANQQRGEITSYIISVCELDTEVCLEYNTPGANYRYTLTSLHPYYEYECKVAAFTISLGDFSPSVTQRTEPDSECKMV